MAKYGDLDLLKSLIENGADADNNEALTHSVKNNHLDIVKYLVEHGAYVTQDIINQSSGKIKDFLQQSSKSKLFKNYKSNCNSTLLNDLHIINIGTQLNQIFNHIEMSISGTPS